MKVIALKIFKVMRPLLVSSGYLNEAGILTQPEADAYQTVFNSATPYDMVLILKDGTRWKLDPAAFQTKKLNLTVDIENIMRFECIFMPKIELETQLKEYTAEITRELTLMADQGLQSVD